MSCDMALAYGRQKENERGFYTLNKRREMWLVHFLLSFALNIEVIHHYPNKEITNKNELRPAAAYFQAICMEKRTHLFKLLLAKVSVSHSKTHC